MPFRSNVFLVQGNRMRHCTYCNSPIQTAFYLPQTAQRPASWACAPCYVEHVVVPATKQPNSPAQELTSAVA